MPLISTPFPHVANSINGPTAPAATFLIFYSDYVDGQMWCPDCRAVESTVKEAFDGPEKPKGIINWVGIKEEWRKPNNKARVDYNVVGIPTIIRIENGKETARLVEDEILDKQRFEAFLK
ncbi:hypothetical protein CI109_104888 [Kwoniella shandongensis]|uniref:Uncharacterized protein n=1 Tax=Kwoniella shandongensis TaxID=1734106 RepID=A0A5M6BQ82_9TREE|nr:uncharacterized protein CI109_006607 [Kwoniella shandongensis]KAA5525056.1 hypothetical protein CI109_006607 [Kwoniella shandongensis]